MPQHYIKIEIKGDKNKLPEKSGEYEVLFNGGFYGTAKFDKTDSIASQGVIWWINKIKVYWLPVPELQQPEQTEGAELSPEIVTKMQNEFEPHPDTAFKQGMYSGYAFGLQAGYKLASQSHNNTVVRPSETEIFVKIHLERNNKLQGKGNMSTQMISLGEVEWMDICKIVTNWALSQCKAIDLRNELIKFWTWTNAGEIDSYSTRRGIVDDYLKSPENK